MFHQGDRACAVCVLISPVTGAVRIVLLKKITRGRKIDTRRFDSSIGLGEGCWIGATHDLGLGICLAIGVKMLRKAEGFEQTVDLCVSCFGHVIGVSVH